MSETTETGRTTIDVNPDDFRDVLWPAKTDVNVYVSGARSITSQKTGKQYLALSFVAADDQTNPDLKPHAGESAEFMFSTGGRPQERKIYRSLLFAAFGALRSFEPEELNGLPFVIQVTHGKEDAEGSRRMFLESVKAEG